MCPQQQQGHFRLFCLVIHRNSKNFWFLRVSGPCLPAGTFKGGPYLYQGFLLSYLLFLDHGLYNLIRDFKFQVQSCFLILIYSDSQFFMFWFLNKLLCWRIAQFWIFFSVLLMYNCSFKSLQFSSIMHLSHNASLSFLMVFIWMFFLAKSCKSCLFL